MLVLAVVVLICIVESSDTWISSSESVIGENSIDSSSEKILELTEDELLQSGFVLDSPTCTSIDWTRLIS